MNVEIRYFSATGGTRKVVTEFIRGLNCEGKFIDITLPENRNKFLTVEADIEVIAVPVHGERIPGFIYDHLRSINGNGLPLVALVVYGNMDIGVCLGQFERLARDSNLWLIAAGAFVGEHSFYRFGSLRQAQGAALPQAQDATLGQAQGTDGQNLTYAGNHVGMGRPDPSDMMEIFTFGQRVRKKLENGTADCILIPKPKLPMFITGFPERGTRFIVRRPDSDRQVCRQCGLCSIKCPVGAIDEKNFCVDESKCIRCMSCVRYCPVSARTSGFKLKVFDRVFGYMGRKPKSNIIIC